MLEMGLVQQSRRTVTWSGRLGSSSGLLVSAYRYTWWSTAASRSAGTKFATYVWTPPNRPWQRYRTSIPMRNASSRLRPSQQPRHRRPPVTSAGAVVDEGALRRPGHDDAQHPGARPQDRLLRQPGRLRTGATGHGDEQHGRPLGGEGQRVRDGQDGRAVEDDDVRALLEDSEQLAHALRAEQLGRVGRARAARQHREPRDVRGHEVALDAVAERRGAIRWRTRAQVSP